MSGASEDGLEPAYGKVPLNVVVMQQDYVRLNMLKRHPRGVLRSLKVGARTMWAKATGKNLVGMGRALIAPLRIGLQKAGVPVQLNTALTDLYVEDGAVRGIYVVADNGHHAGRQTAVDAEEVDLRARRGWVRRRARTVDLIGAAGARAGLRTVDRGFAAAGAAVPDVRRPQPAAL